VRSDFSGDLEGFQELPVAACDAIVVWRRLSSGASKNSRLIREKVPADHRGVLRDRRLATGWLRRYRRPVAKTALSRIRRGCGMAATDTRPRSVYVRPIDVSVPMDFSLGSFGGLRADRFQQFTLADDCAPA
jgi:hypothetical protein